MPEEIKRPEQPKPKIIKTFLCEKCSFEAKSDQDYKQHRIDHNLGKEFKPYMHPVTGEPVEAIDTIQPENKPAVEAPVMPQKGLKSVGSTNITPITLKYIFEGTCPVDNNRIETIPLDIEIEKNKKFVVIAWCNNCKKNIQQRVVNKL